MEMDKIVIDTKRFSNFFGWFNASIPCSSETNPPIVKIKTATTSVQKYSSLPLPSGYISGLSFFACLIPNQSKN